MPGRTLSRASRQAGHIWFSFSGLGRGPTTLIWPTQDVPELRASSSTFNLRSHLPT